MPRSVIQIVLEVIGVDVAIWCPDCALPCAGHIHIVRTIGPTITMSSHFHCPECNRHRVVA